jgi:signal transduction histidine kinase
MTTHLRRRIGLGLFLLLLLPLGFYEARSLVASSSQRLNPATLQSLLISYQWQLQQRLALAVSATQLQAPLPPEFSAYWQKDQQTWQGQRRVPALAETSCPPAPGRIIPHASAHRIQLYLCMEHPAQKQLFLLNVPALLSQQPLPLETLSLALVDPEQQRLFQLDAHTGELLSTPILADSPYKPILNSHQNTQQSTTLDASWVTTSFGWPLVLLQHQEQDPWRWVWLAGTLGLCMLLSWTLPAWLAGYIYRRFRYLTQAAAQIALGNFTFRLPSEKHDELELINTVFNRMLDEIQIQKQRLHEQNDALQAGNESLRETLETVQNMQSERFVKASTILQHAESQILRQLLKWPVQQMTDLGHQLQQQQELLDSQLHHTALDRNQLYQSSQNTVTLVQQLQSQLNQVLYLLDHYQPEANKEDLGEKQPIQLVQLLQETVQRLMPHWQPQGHQVYIRCPAHITLDSYPQAIGQVISNLMMNSLHHGFSPGYPGEIVISVKQDAQHVVMTFRDNGCGIPEKLEEKLFQPFQSANPDASGNSLGLYLTRQLIQQLLNGSILYQPTESPGACFIITLPLDVAAEQPGI